MPRERKEFRRPAPFRDASLIVIACEGAGTEPKYFDGLRQVLHSPRLKIVVLKRDDPSKSSPDAVVRELNDYAISQRTLESDQLWLVIDRDAHSWREEMISNVAQLCHQKGYHLALSNPCFEIWLLLHFEDIPAQDQSRQQRLFENEDRLLKHEEAKYRHAAPELNYIDHLFPRTESAIQRAEQLDINPQDRWPNTLGTRVYKLVRTILERVNFDRA